MEEAALKEDLIDRIEHADGKQLQEIYGLLINYFNRQDKDTEEWDLLPEYQKKRILESLAEADAGLGTPLEEVVKNTRNKYGLNG